MIFLSIDTDEDRNIVEPFLAEQKWDKTVYYEDGLSRLLQVLSTGPAALIGEARSLQPGATADLVVFDPAARWRVQASDLVSGSSNTPLLGMELPGVVRLTVADGRVTYRNGLGSTA